MAFRPATKTLKIEVELRSVALSAATTWKSETGRICGARPARPVVQRRAWEFDAYQRDSFFIDSIRVRDIFLLKSRDEDLGI